VATRPRRGPRHSLPWRGPFVTMSCGAGLALIIDPLRFFLVRAARPRSYAKYPAIGPTSAAILGRLDRGLGRRSDAEVAFSEGLPLLSGTARVEEGVPKPPDVFLHCPERPVEV
jgi:hypothetical protein